MSNEKCEHTFVSKLLTKPVPTFCAYCQRIIWVFQGTVHNCSKCDIFFHDACFKQILRNKEALVHDPEASPRSDAASNDSHTHTHTFEWKTWFTPTFCGACNKLLVGFRKQGLECTGCDLHVHKDCIPTGSDVVGAKSASPAPVSVERGLVQPKTTGSGVPQPDSAAVSTEPVESEKVCAMKTSQDVAMSNTLQMLDVFNQRNKRWKSTALNPMSMLALYNRHATLYTQACASLPDAALPLEDLQRIRSVLRYATAAYGQAYDEGFFANCFGAVLMRISRRDVLAPKCETNTQAVCNILALPRSSIKYSTWSGEIFEPNFYVMVDEMSKNVVLCFRGSLSDADFLTDACGELSDFLGGQAHRGMLQMTDRVFANEEAMRILKRQLEKHPEYRFIITGHSLGAGLTCLFAAKALHERTFGDRVPMAYAFAPPPTVTLPLAAEFDDRIISIVAAKDCVPRLQYNSLDRLGHEVSSYKQTAEEAVLASKELNSDLTEETHIIGKIYMVTKPTNRDTRLVIVARTHILLHQIFLSKYMVTNHHMHNYDAGLAAMLQKTKSEAKAAHQAVPETPLEKSMFDEHGADNDFGSDDDEEADNSALFSHVDGGAQADEPSADC